MNQSEYFEKLEKLNSRSALSTIESLLNYCQFSVNPFNHLNKNDLKDCEIIIYSYDTRFSEYVAEYSCSSYKKLLEFVKSKCTTSILQ